MKQIEQWRWRVHHAITGKVFTTRYAMSESDALERDPLAVRVDWTREVRLVPETDHELHSLGASSMLRKR